MRRITLHMTAAPGGCVTWLQQRLGPVLCTLDNCSGHTIPTSPTPYSNITDMKCHYPQYITTLILNFNIQTNQISSNIAIFPLCCWLNKLVKTFKDFPSLFIVLPKQNTQLHSEQHQEEGCGDAGYLHVTHSWGSWLLGLCGGGGGGGAVALRSDSTLLLS